MCATLREGLWIGALRNVALLHVVVALGQACVSGCGATTHEMAAAGIEEASEEQPEENFVEVTSKTRIADVIADPVLGEWGRLLFPVDRGYVYGSTLPSMP